MWSDERGPTVCGFDDEASYTCTQEPGMCDEKEQEGLKLKMLRKGYHWLNTVNMHISLH